MQNVHGVEFKGLLGRTLQAHRFGDVPTALHLPIEDQLLILTTCHDLLVDAQVGEHAYVLVFAWRLVTDASERGIL